MNAHHLFLAVPLVPLAVALVVLTWRARQGRKAAQEKRDAERMEAMLKAFKTDAPVHRPRFSAPSTSFQQPPVSAGSWVDIQLEPFRRPEFLAHMPQELPTLRFVGAGPWECVPSGSDNSTPASSNTCASSSSDSSSTSGID